MPNPLGFGIGGRAGVQIVGLYGGVALVNYFGESTGPSYASVSRHALLYGVEGGYGSKMGPLTVRAQVGVGDYAETVDFTLAPGAPAAVGANGGTHNSLYLEPGLLAMLALGSFLIGADANILMVTNRAEADGSSSFDVGFTVHGQLGWKF
jgi:hypothetical protein